MIGVAKAGSEDGHALIGGPAIVAPTGEVVAEAQTLDDELLIHDCDLDQGLYIKETVFNFEKHRRIEHYARITGQTGVTLPGGEDG